MLTERKNMEDEMKIVAVLGSPRKQSASSKIVKAILKGAEENGHESIIYEASKINLKGCQACGVCKKNEIDCIQNDDLKSYWNDLHDADVLIVSSPNYHATVCGPMVSFLNRHCCLRKKDRTLRLESGKRIIGVFSQGNTDVDGYKSAYDWYLSRFNAYGMESADMIIHTEQMSVADDSDIIKRAYELGKKL